MNISTYESQIKSLEAGGGGGGGGATVTIHATAIDDSKFSIPFSDMANLTDGTLDKVLLIHPYPAAPATSVEEILRFSGTDAFLGMNGFYYIGFDFESGLTPKIDHFMAGDRNGVPMIINIFINSSLFTFTSQDGGMAIYQLQN